MSFLKAPKSESSDFYDQARFELTWKASLFFTILLPILIIVFIFIEETTIVPTIIGWGLCFVFLISLYKTKSYRFTAIFFSTAGSILCLATLLGIPQGYHFADPFWMIIITLFAFFTLGEKWGIFTGLINLLGIIYFIVVMGYDNLTSVLQKGFDLDQRIAMAANISVASILICYLILQFIKTKRIAEFQLKDVNITLADQNKIISTKNQEKTVMLKEIHHRVKNNLQVVSSLLRLQSAKTDDSESKVSYQDTINRVSTMALIHEKMYQNENLSNINLTEYIESLISEILKSYSISAQVSFKVESEIENLEIKTLVPFALIINELVSNSLKHAFTENMSGKIDIQIRRLKNTQFKLSYTDSGTWKETALPNQSFGLELIEILTEQLEGVVEKHTSPNTNWIFKLQNLA